MGCGKLREPRNIHSDMRFNVRNSTSLGLTLQGQEHCIPIPASPGILKTKESQAPWFYIGCSFLAYTWTLPAHSGAFLLTVDNFSVFCSQLELFCLQLELFCLQLELFCSQWESASSKGLKGL